MSNRERVVREALTLSREDRTYIADMLEQSLDEGDVPQDIAAAWSKEINRRIAAYDRAETDAVDVATSNARLREALVARRAAKSP